MGDQSHIHLLEQGNISQFGGIHARTVKNLPDGTFSLDELKSKLRSHDDYVMSALYSATSLVCIENTHNICSGSVLPLSFIRSVKQIADENQLKVHMDGARVLNAAIALDVSPADCVKDVDSVSVCLSKVSVLKKVFKSKNRVRSILTCFLSKGPLLTDRNDCVGRPRIHKALLQNPKSNRRWNATNR